MVFWFMPGVDFGTLRHERMEGLGMSDCFAVRGDICYSLGPDRLYTLKGGYLVCEGGRSLGVFAELPRGFRECPVHDYGDALVIPGLVDLHVHAPQHSYRTLGMDLELIDWLDTHTFPEEAKYGDTGYAQRPYADFVEEMTKGPNTRACVFATVHKDATLLLMDMLETSGMVTMVGKVNMDRNAPDALSEGSAEQSLAETRAWLEAVGERGYQRTLPILTPRFVPSCTDELMRGLGEIQRETGVVAQSHLSENLSECEWVRELCPDATSYADAYDRFGLFGSGGKTLMAHCVWSDEAERALMRKQGVYMVHCPQSNMNVASGIAPARRFLREGVPMGLGSDVAGGCHVSIFRAMSDAIQASKLYWRLVDTDCKPLSLEEAFFLATASGGSFFGQVGSFAEGFEMDAVVIDDTSLRPARELSIEDRLARVVYLSDDRHIVQKYVRGQPLRRQEVPS